MLSKQLTFRIIPLTAKKGTFFLQTADVFKEVKHFRLKLFPVF